MDYYDRFIESTVLGMILAVMPDDIPSLREARIQNQKLQRLITKPRSNSGRTASAMLAGEASLRKWKKDEQKHSREVSEQAKKVHRLCDTFFKDFLRRDKPKLTNAEYQVWKRSLDKGLTDGAAKMKARAREHALMGGLKGLSRKGGAT